MAQQEREPAEMRQLAADQVVMPALFRRLFLEIESRTLLCRVGFGGCIVILALAALLPADIVIRSELPAKL